MNKTHEKYFI